MCPGSSILMVIYLLSSVSFYSFFQGQFFSGSDHRVYLLGNPIIWWSNLVFLALFVAVFLVEVVKYQRNSGSTQNTAPASADEGKTWRSDAILE